MDVKRVDGSVVGGGGVVVVTGVVKGELGRGVGGVVGVVCVVGGVRSVA